MAHGARFSRRLRRTAAASSALLTIPAIHSAESLGLRFNWTLSAPVGVYRELTGPSRRGDLALLCLPPNIESLARARRYLSAGSCAGGSSPVLKQVVALPGDEVELRQNFFAVNGRMLDRLLPLATKRRFLDILPRVAGAGGRAREAGVRAAEGGRGLAATGARPGSGGVVPFPRVCRRRNGNRQPQAEAAVAALEAIGGAQAHEGLADRGIARMQRGA